jgi:hypothetical protein
MDGGIQFKNGVIVGKDGRIAPEESFRELSPWPLWIGCSALNKLSSYKDVGSENIFWKS